MDKNLTAQLIASLSGFSQRNRTSEKFDEEDFIQTFEQLSPFVTSVEIKFNDFDLLRSRSTQIGLDFENVKQMSYPPSSRAKLCRCNFEKQPILYGSNSVETSFLEIGFNENQPCAVIVHFRLKQGMELTLLPIGELDHYRRHKKSRLGTAGLAEQLEYILSSREHYDAITQLYVDAYLADFFSRTQSQETERNLYEVTSRIANGLLMQAHIDGLIYPSVKHIGGLNYAIKPSVFDQKFEVVKYALTAPVHDLGYGLFEYYVHAEGSQLDQNGNFIFHTNPHFNARTTWPLSADQ